MKLRGIPNPSPSLSPSGRLWPNGEFSVGWHRHRPDEPLDNRPLADSWGDERGEGGAPPPIDLVSVPNSHKPRAQRGELGITTYGRRMLRNGVYTLRERFPNLPLTLGTLTVPPLLLADRRELAGRWGEVVRQTIQWLSRELQRKALPPLVLSCSEIQPSRLATDREAYLHLHLIWVNPPTAPVEWGIDADRLRAFWDNLLRRITGVENLPSANIDLKYARGDVARELSKYLSKGSSVLAAAAKDLGRENLPRTWWNMSQPLRDLIKAAILCGSEVGRLFLEWIEYDKGQAECGLFLWLRDIYQEIEDRQVLFGHTGQLSPPLNEDAHEILVSV